jgi:hypothetical protein
LASAKNVGGNLVGEEEELPQELSEKLREESSHSRFDKKQAVRVQSQAREPGGG